MVLGMMDKKDIIYNMKTYGFCIIENYWDKEQCDTALKQFLNLPRDVFETGQGGDLRCQFTNSYCRSAFDFLKDEFIQDIAKEYSRCHVADRVVGGIVHFNPEQEIDSGGGWHVDSKIEAQFKSFMYLTDVGPDNGPFMFVQKSKALAEDLPMYSNNRISQETIDEKFDSSDIIEITGGAGTCVLADSTYVHRGKQIQSGTRCTFTTYFYE